MSESPETPTPIHGPLEDEFNGLAESESVLARDWNAPEEDAAWANL
jgi:hypothetical protein